MDTLESITLYLKAQDKMFLNVPICLINLKYVSDFAHEGRRKQAPQSKTGELFIVCVSYVTPAPLDGSSIKE